MSWCRMFDERREKEVEMSSFSRCRDSGRNDQAMKMWANENQGNP